MRRFLFYFATAPFYLVGVLAGLLWESLWNGWMAAQFWLDGVFHPDE